MSEHYQSKNTHACKLFGITNVPLDEQEKMIHRAARAGAAIYCKNKRHERECATCSHAVSVLAGMCAADHDTIVDHLTGYLWDEEEAGAIKAFNAKGTP